MRPWIRRLRVDPHANTAPRPASGPIEALEPRQLPSAPAATPSSPSASRNFARLSGGGTLHVRGTPGPDHIAFVYGAEQQSDGSANSFFDVHMNGAVRRVPAERIRRIIVQGGSGNDELDASGATIPRPSPRRPVIVNGGPGDDTITGSITTDRLTGGPGNDQIFARDNNADEVLGGPGHDQAQLNPADEMGLNGDRARGVEVLLPMVSADVSHHPPRNRQSTPSRPMAAAASPRFARLSRGGTLHVRGTPGPDRVSMAQASEQRPDGGYDNFFDVHLNDAVRRFPLKDVRRIVVHAGRGDDQVDARGAQMLRPIPRNTVTINGGPGNDTIIGGPNSARILGGPGDDIVFARANQNSDVVVGDQAELNGADYAGLRGDRARGVEVVLFP